MYGFARVFALSLRVSFVSTEFDADIEASTHESHFQVQCRSTEGFDRCVDAFQIAQIVRPQQHFSFFVRGLIHMKFNAFLPFVPFVLYSFNYWSLFLTAVII